MITKNTADTLRKSKLSFKEHIINISDLKAVRTNAYRSDRTAGNKKNLLATGIDIDGDVKLTSDRFWNSFAAKVGVGTNIFNLFSHSEVLNRVKENKKFTADGDVRVVEDVKNNRLLAITDPQKPCVEYDSILDLIDNRDGYSVNYNNGIITSSHRLENAIDLKIGPDDFSQRIVVETPIDGYGLPNIYLGLLRMVCTNGVIAMGKAFKSSVKLSKKKNRPEESNIQFMLDRMFDSFSNDEGYDALVRRLDVARSSPLSVNEAYKIGSEISKFAKSKDGNNFSSVELSEFYQLTGDMYKKYGIVNLDQLSNKQKALLSTDATVMDAINFVTEITTHRINHLNQSHVAIARRLHGIIGSLISKPYDLENSEDPVDVFPAFYFSDN